MINVSALKKQASILKEYLKSTHSEISHSSCLHAVSKIHGYKDWTTASALLAKEINVDASILDKLTDSDLSLKIDRHVMEGALSQLIKMCGVDDVESNFIIFKDTSGECLGFKLVSKSLIRTETISCGSFKSIEDKREKGLLSGQYLAVLIHNMLTNSLFNNKVNTDKKDLKKLSSKVDHELEMLAAKLRGRSIDIYFECSDPENRPALLAMKKIIEEADVMDDRVFKNLHYACGEFYFLTDEGDDEIGVLIASDKACLDNSDIAAIIKAK